MHPERLVQATMVKAVPDARSASVYLYRGADRSSSGEESERRGSRQTALREVSSGCGQGRRVA